MQSPRNGIRSRSLAQRQVRRGRQSRTIPTRRIRWRVTCQRRVPKRRRRSSRRLQRDRHRRPRKLPTIQRTRRRVTRARRLAAPAASTRSHAECCWRRDRPGGSRRRQPSCSRDQHGCTAVAGPRKSGTDGWSACGARREPRLRWPLLAGTRRESEPTLDITTPPSRRRRGRRPRCGAVATLASTAAVAGTLDVVIEAESMTVSPASAGNIFKDSSASGRKALRLSANATASQTVSLPASTSLVIRARGDQYNGCSDA